jgi:hypothetical protein
LLQLCLHCKFAIQNWFGNDHRSAAVRSAHRWTKLYSYGANMAAPKSSQDADAGIGPLERLENNWADRKGRVRMLCSVDFQHHRFSDQHAGASFRSRSWRLYRSTSRQKDRKGQVEDRQQIPTACFRRSRQTAHLADRISIPRGRKSGGPRRTDGGSTPASTCGGANIQYKLVERLDLVIGSSSRAHRRPA